MPEKAILTVGDKQYELPIITGTEGERAVDITKLRDQTGLVTYDPSLGNTGVCRSAITFTDGEKGILRYRGIPIEQFTNKPNFVEAAWLLIFGRLPHADGTQAVQRSVDRQRAAARGHEGPVPAHSAECPADGHSFGHSEPPGLPPPGVLRAGNATSRWRKPPRG